MHNSVSIFIKFWNPLSGQLVRSSVKPSLLTSLQSFLLLVYRFVVWSKSGEWLAVKSTESSPPFPIPAIKSLSVLLPLAVFVQVPLAASFSIRDRSEDASPLLPITTGKKLPIRERDSRFTLEWPRRDRRIYAKSLDLDGRRDDCWKQRFTAWI